MAKGHFVDPVMQISLHSKSTNKTHTHTLTHYILLSNENRYDGGNKFNSANINDYFFASLLRRQD